MQLITLDFETAYGLHPTERDAEGKRINLTLTSLTTEEYVRHPLFKVHGCGIKRGDEPSYWVSGEDLKEHFDTIDWSDTAVIAHHAQFDGAILNWIYGIKPKFWICTQSMGAFCWPQERSGLATLAKLTGIGQKGIELSSTKGLWDLTEAQEKVLADYCVNDVELTYKLWRIMKGQVPLDELKLIDLTVRMFTEPVLRIDAPLLEVEAKRMEEEKQVALAKVMELTGGDLKSIRSNPKFAALLQAEGVDPPRKVSPTTGELTWAFAKTDEEFIALADHPNPVVKFLAEARLQLKTSIDETRTRRYIDMGKRGSFPVYLRYFGARNTGRFSAGDKQNTQNMRRGSVLRQSVLAPEGMKLVACDLAAIEARVLAWLAGQHDLTDLFADGADIYSVFATKIFGYEVTKKLKVERQVGKCCVLGLGFSLGWVKFASIMLSGPMGAPPIQFNVDHAKALGLKASHVRAADIQEKMSGVSTLLPPLELAIHCAVTKRIVEIYRESNDKIVAYWKTCNTMIHDMIRGRVMQYGPITTGPNTLTMPNGVVLHYPHLEEHGNREFKYKGRNGWERIYGGKITENCVQSLARCVMTDQMLRIAKRYKVAMTVHDEVVVAVPLNDTEAVRWMEEQMSIGPAWAAGLPLAAEANEGPNYGECK